MPTQVRSYSKINLGLAIGPVRSDGFHGLATVYQTLELHDLVTVEARRLPVSESSKITLACNHEGVPADSRNTAWRMVEQALCWLGVAAEVHIEIDKRLPVQGGLGAGSANAAAALIGLERELGLGNQVPPLPLHSAQGSVGRTNLSGPERLELASEIGSDVPLFLIGGAALGLGRGEEVYPLPDFPSYECVVAVPDVSVSTPQAFRDWDARTRLDEPTSQDRDVGHPAPTQSKTGLEWGAQSSAEKGGLTFDSASDTLKRLSRSFAFAFSASASGAAVQSDPNSSGVSPQRGDLAENPLLALVRTGIENDFESVVFPQYPLLGDIKRTLAVSSPEYPEQSALYAALSGSGSAVFGLYATTEAANAAQQRLGKLGITALRTRTLPRAEYWQEMMPFQGRRGNRWSRRFLHSATLRSK